MLGISFEPIAVPKVEKENTSNMTDGILFDRKRRKLNATTMRLKSSYMPLTCDMLVLANPKYWKILSHLNITHSKF